MRAAVLLMLVGAAFGAAPRAMRTPEQGLLMRGRTGLWNLGLKAWEEGKQADAIAALGEVLEIERGLLGPWHGDTESTAATLGDWHQSRAEWALEAEKRRAVIEASARLRGPGHWRTVDARLDLAEALAQQDRTPARREAVARGESLNREAVALFGQGEYARALPLYRQALALRKETLGEKHPHYASTLGNLASVHRAMGDYDTALALSRRAHSITRDALGKSHPRYAIGLNNLAGLHNALGDSKAALPLYKQALTITKEALGEGHPHYAQSLNNLARCHKDLGDIKAALSLVVEAMAIYKEVLPERHPDLVIGLNNLAELYRLNGEHKAALSLLHRALALCKGTVGDRHPLHAAILHNLAGHHQEMGGHEVALPLIEKALDIVMAQLRENASVQSDRQQLAAAAHARLYLDIRLGLPDREGHPTAAAHVLAGKGFVLLRQQQRRLFLRLAADPASRAAAARLQKSTGELAALKLSHTATRAKLESLEAEQEDAQAALARLSAPFREARDKEKVTPEALAAALPDGAALVDYLFYWRSGVKDRDGKPRSERRLAAFVHRKGKPAVRVELGKALDAEDAVREWRPLLKGGKPDLKLGGRLERLVYAPLEKHLGGATIVLVSPDGVLGTVPFAALPGKKEGSYLVEEVAVAVVPVPSAIPELMRPVDRKARLAPSLLVAGDLRYDPAEKAAPPAGADDRSAPRSGRLSFSRLPATGAEARAVRASFERLFKGGTCLPLGDGDATKAAVRKALAGVRYAHFATHGYFTPEAVPSAADGRPTGWHPLLLSGLALSDANRVPKGGEEDGILTALEVSEMDLTKLELAVLSACETGLGKVAGGEGLLGMQRAFQIAGARSVIASLWKVDDKATQQLMQEFYAAAWDTKKVISRAEALRAAQLAMLREGRKRGAGKEPEEVGKPSTRLPPYYWAGFVLSGDWR